jgi:hypothetical protein
LVALSIIAPTIYWTYFSGPNVIMVMQWEYQRWWYLISFLGNWSLHWKNVKEMFGDWNLHHITVTLHWST